MDMTPEKHDRIRGKIDAFMTVINTVPSYKPRCPNHGEELGGTGFPLPAKGSGRCPVSGASFEFEVEVDEDKVVVDKNGTPTKSKDWKVEGDD